MALFWKAIGGLLIAVVLGLMLDVDMSTLLSIAVCAMGVAVALHYLQPVLSLIRQMQDTAALESESFEILFRIVGIGLISEIAQLVCTDSGNSAMAKLLSILTKAGILWLSIPVFQGVLSILRQILGEI